MSKVVLYGRPHVRENQGLIPNFVTATAGVCGRMILKWILKTWYGGRVIMDSIYLAESRGRWWEPVNAVMNLEVP